MIQEIQMISGCISKEEFETITKKWVERMKACLATNRWYFEKKKRNIKCTASESKDNVSEKMCFRSFSFLRGKATVFIKPTVTRDLFDIQMSADDCWKDNALQNTGALLEFR